MWCPHCHSYLDNVTYDDPAREVTRLACEMWQVDLAELLSPCRKSRVVAVRQTAMAVLYHEFGMSLVEIGDALDRDHTTVLHGVRVADPDRVAALTAAVTA